MRWALLSLRFVATVLLAVWFGGFTFYGGVVVGELHVDLDHLAAGQITRRVTDGLNQLGIAALAACWLLAWAERGLGTRRLRAGRLGLLAADSVLLGSLMVLHRVMDRR